MEANDTNLIATKANRETTATKLVETDKKDTATKAVEVDNNEIVQIVSEILSEVILWIGFVNVDVFEIDETSPATIQPIVQIVGTQIKNELDDSPSVQIVST